jgi:membrane associated rhomboid family serine protease
MLIRLATLPDERAVQIMLALAVVPARLLEEPWGGQALTLLTSCFLHAGWVHLLGNMLFLAVFGPPVESRLGWWRFSALFAAAGVVGALAHVWARPDSLVPLVGASGAIAGVLGAHLVLEPKAKVTVLIPAFVTLEVASLPAAFVIALWFALQVASNVASVTSQTPVDSVAWMAHIAGFVAGVIMVIPARLTGGRGRRKKRLQR